MDYTLPRSASMSEVIERVQKIVDDLHRGELECVVPRQGNPSVLRRTPHFSMQAESVARSTHEGRLYTATWVAQMMNEAIDSGFCGTKVRHYKASERVTTALNLLSAQERGLLPHVDLSRISDVLSTEVLKDFIDIKLKRPRSKRKEFQLKS